MNDPTPATARVADTPAGARAGSLAEAPAPAFWQSFRSRFYPLTPAVPGTSAITTASVTSEANRNPVD